MVVFYFLVIIIIIFCVTLDCDMAPCRYFGACVG